MRRTPNESTTREPAGAKVVLLTLAGLVVLLGGAYAAAYVAAGDNVPRGTTVAGVEIGGRTSDEAVAALRDGLGERGQRPVEVRVDGKTATVAPAEAGLSVDYDATVAEVGGERSWSPGRLWTYWTGGDAHDPVVDVDDSAFAAAVDRINQQVGTPARDGQVRFRDGRAVVTKSRPGEGVDEDEARTALTAAFVAAKDEPVELDAAAVQPDIDDDDVQQALDSFANPALSAPVTLVFGKSPVELAPQDFAAVLRLRPEDGKLVPDLDAAALGRLVDEGVSDHGAPVDATVRLVGGKPKVIPAKPGVTYQPKDVSDAFLTLVTKPEGQRRMTVKATVAEPEFTTADAQALGIKEKVSTFTTYYPYAEYRNVNIGRAAELVDGTILKPGETFSLNDIVGERTRENGFTTGYIISDGLFKEDLGGGVSQMATTTFNAMYFAGLKDIEHKPHSVYIDRYPEGREATVAWGSVDLRFQNDTKYGVLVHATVTPSDGSAKGVVTVSMWSTKTWDITSKTSGRYNFRAPKTRTLTTPDCEPAVGSSGFDVDVTRYFHQPGSSTVTKSQKFHTSYIAADNVKCEKPGKGDKTG